MASPNGKLHVDLVPHSWVELWQKLDTVGYSWIPHSTPRYGPFDMANQTRGDFSASCNRFDTGAPLQPPILGHRAGAAFQLKVGINWFSYWNWFKNNCYWNWINWFIFCMFHVIEAVPNQLWKMFFNAERLVTLKIAATWPFFTSTSGIFVTGGKLTC